MIGILSQIAEASDVVLRGLRHDVVAYAIPRIEPERRRRLKLPLKETSRMLATSLREAALEALVRSTSI